MKGTHIVLVLVAAVVIGFMGTKLTGAHQGDHSGGNMMISDASGGVYHVFGGRVRHCMHEGAGKKVTCSNWDGN